MNKNQTVFCLLVLLLICLFPQPASAESIRCESRNGETRHCGSDIIEARLVQQLSDYTCQRGRNWGLRNGHIWVSSYCQGVFRIQRGVDPTNHLTVSHTGQGSGSIVSSPGGIDYPARSEASFPSGTTVSVYATPEEGSVFSGWSGDCSGGRDCTVLLTENRSVTAHFNKVSIAPILKLLLEKDEVNPTVSITYPTSSSHVTSISLLTLRGTASGYVTEVAWSNDRGGSGICDGTASWRADAIALYSGDNLIRVTARDAAAGRTAIDTLIVTYDPAAPTVSINSPTLSPRYRTGMSPLSIGGGAWDDLGVTEVTWSNNRGGSGICSGTTSWDASDIPLYNEDNLITVTARDAAGNTATDTLIVTYDPTNPAVIINSPTTSSNYTTNDSSLNIGGTATDNLDVTEVTWSNDRGGSGICSGTTSWAGSDIPLSNQENLITVTAWDAEGNSSTDTLTVTYDPEDPVVSITSPYVRSTYFTANSPLTIMGTAEDNIGIDRVEWSSDRGFSGDCSGTISWNCSGITLLDDYNSITVTAWDLAGNSSSDHLTVIYDETDPTVIITEPSDDYYYSTPNTPLSIKGNASDNRGVTQVSWVNDRGGSGSCSGIDPFAASGIVLQPGRNLITVTARDALGNTGSRTLTVDYELSRPVLYYPPVGEVMDNGCTVTNTTDWFFSWYHVDGATKYRLYVLGPSASIPLIDIILDGENYYHYVRSGGYIINDYRIGWRWWVQAGNDNNMWSSWSLMRTFDVEPLNTDCMIY